MLMICWFVGMHKKLRTIVYNDLVLFSIRKLTKGQIMVQELFLEF